MKMKETILTMIDLKHMIDRQKDLLNIREITKSTTNINKEEESDLSLKPLNLEHKMRED